MFERPFLSNGFIVATTVNGVGSSSVALDCDLRLLHRFEQRALRFRRRAVNLVCDDEIREHGLLQFELAVSR